MKIIIILSLAAICLAKSRKAFHFPSSVKAVNHIVFEPENGKSHNSEKSSEESDLVLSNPSRRDVKIESPVFGFRGKAGHSGGIKNISPEEPIFIENTTPVLEKGKSSSSEESQAVDDKQEASSSEESNQEEANAVDANQNVSSGEENKAAAVNQDDSSNEENSLQAIKEKEASSEEINATNANQDTSNDEQIIKPAESQEEPKIKVFNGKIRFQPFSRAIKLIPRDVDRERPEAAKHSRGRGHRLLRSIELNLPELDIKPNVQGPQGSIQTAKKRVRRPAKQ